MNNCTKQALGRKLARCEASESDLRRERTELLSRVEAMARDAARNRHGDSANTKVSRKSTNFL